MIAFQCTGCGKTYSVQDEFAGRKTKCANCGAHLVVPCDLSPDVSLVGTLPTKGEVGIQPVRSKARSIVPFVAVGGVLSILLIGACAGVLAMTLHGCGSKGSGLGQAADQFSGTPALDDVFGTMPDDILPIHGDHNLEKQKRDNWFANNLVGHRVRLALPKATVLIEADGKGKFVATVELNSIWDKGSFYDAELRNWKVQLNETGPEYQPIATRNLSEQESLRLREYAKKNPIEVEFDVTQVMQGTERFLTVSFKHGEIVRKW